MNDSRESTTRPPEASSHLRRAGGRSVSTRRSEEPVGRGDVIVVGFLLLTFAVACVVCVAKLLVDLFD